VVQSNAAAIALTTGWPGRDDCPLLLIVFCSWRSCKIARCCVLSANSASLLRIWAPSPWPGASRRCRRNSPACGVLGPAAIPVPCPAG